MMFIPPLFCTIRTLPLNNDFSTIFNLNDDDNDDDDVDDLLDNKRFVVCNAKTTSIIRRLPISKEMMNA